MAQQDQLRGTVIQVRIPLGEPGEVQLLHAAAKIVSHQPAAFDQRALVARIQVELWYITTSCRACCHMDQVTAVIRADDKPEGACPSIIGEKYTLQPAAFPFAPSVLEGELSLGWQPHLEMHGEQPIQLVPLKTVQGVYPVSFSLPYVLEPANPIRAVVKSQAEVAVHGDWVGESAVLRGEVNLEFWCEQADGLLVRYLRSVPFAHPEPVAGGYDGELHVLFTQPAVMVTLNDSGTRADLQLLLSGQIYLTSARVIAVAAAGTTGWPAGTTLLPIFVERLLLEKKVEVSIDVMIPGDPQGTPGCRLHPGEIKLIGRTITQDVTGTCDLYYTAPDGERCMEACLEDTFIAVCEASGDLRPDEWSGRIRVSGGPALYPLGPGRWRLLVPVLWTVTARESMDLPIAGGSDGPGVFETVVKERVVSAPVRFLVIPPEGMDARLQAVEVVGSCVPLEDHGVVTGYISGECYRADMSGKERMEQFREPFEEFLAIPGSSPKWEAECRLTATPVFGTPPFIMVEGVVHLTRKTVARVKEMDLEKVAGRPDSIFIEHRLFWQSRPPVSDTMQPFRVDTGSADLDWRFDCGTMLINGRFSRSIFFLDEKKALYCASDFIPFNVATHLPADSPRDWQARISRIEPAVAPENRGFEPVVNLEEEYLLIIEVLSKPGQRKF